MQYGPFCCDLSFVLFLQGLGVPFNIASYSLLTYMIAHVTGLKVGVSSFAANSIFIILDVFFFFFFF